MRILVLGLNYAPEEIGIAVYTRGLCEALAARGHEVEVIAAKPYYPAWRTAASYRGGGARRSIERGIRVTRVPIYVPAVPSAIRRILHQLSFALSALIPALVAAWRRPPDVVWTVTPSLTAAPVALLAARLAGARSWIHVQDFEIEAAFATGLIRRRGKLERIGKAGEGAVMRAFDRASSISREMCARIVALGVAPGRVSELRNWAELGRVRPLDGPSPLRAEWGITTPHVALYSGNIANKQGIEVLVDVARALERRLDLTFVICGEGPNRAALAARAAGLRNVVFRDLQPIERLNDLVGLASVHLLPQRAGAADLVLPSKLTNMLASGRPVVAGAAPGTGLAREVDGCGIVVPPEDAGAFAAAIETLLDDADLRRDLGAAAARRAHERWDREAIVDRFDRELADLVAAVPDRLIVESPQA